MIESTPKTTATNPAPAPVPYDPDALLREYLQLRLENIDLKDRINKNNKRLAALEDRCTDEMERRGVPSINFVGLGNLSLQQDGHVKIAGGTDEKGRYTPEQRDRAAKALIAAGLGELVKPGFDLRSVSARYREWRTQHEHPPPELEGVFEFERNFKLGVKSAPGRTHFQ